MLGFFIFIISVLYLPLSNAVLSESTYWYIRKSTFSTHQFSSDEQTLLNWSLECSYVELKCTQKWLKSLCTSTTASFLLLHWVEQLTVWSVVCGWECSHSVGIARWCSWGTGGRAPGSLFPRCQVRAGCTPCSSTLNSLRRTLTTCSTRSSLHPLQIHTHTR